MSKKKKSLAKHLRKKRAKKLESRTEYSTLPPELSAEFRSIEKAGQQLADGFRKGVLNGKNKQQSDT